MIHKWKRYTGEYEKEEYSILTDNGEYFTPCWPNAGVFHVLDGSHKEINGEQVFYIKQCEEHETSYYKFGKTKT